MSCARLPLLPPPSLNTASPPVLRAQPPNLKSQSPFFKCIAFQREFFFPSFFFLQQESLRPVEYQRRCNWGGGEVVGRGGRVAVRLKAAIKAKWTEHRKTALPTAVPQSGYYMPASAGATTTRITGRAGWCSGYLEVLDSEAREKKTATNIRTRR